VCVYLQQNKKGRRPRVKNVTLKLCQVYLQQNKTALIKLWAQIFFVFFEFFSLDLPVHSSGVHKFVVCV
jgi:hypothetical protein